MFWESYLQRCRIYQKSQKFPHPRKFFPKISPRCFFHQRQAYFVSSKNTIKNMQQFSSFRYCSYDIGILSTCSFLKRFKTTEAGQTDFFLTSIFIVPIAWGWQGQTDLNARYCSVFLRKIKVKTTNEGTSPGVPLGFQWNFVYKYYIMP